MSHTRKSLQIRHVDAGSCNGCEQELTALTSRAYDLQRYGLDLVASPRHADALLVTGPVTDTMAAALSKVWDAVPNPKILIALGDCARGCGVFQAAYASHGGVKGAQLQIPGCPPEPGPILAALKTLLTSEASPRAIRPRGTTTRA
ncbi:MAG: oxidoreductase [Thermaerobacter sp.]|nr:oxidoreductase [Thermaerobacter sp.]